MLFIMECQFVLKMLVHACHIFFTVKKSSFLFWIFQCLVILFFKKSTNNNIEDKLKFHICFMTKNSCYQLNKCVICD